MDRVDARSDRRGCRWKNARFDVSRSRHYLRRTATRFSTAKTISKVFTFPSFTPTSQDVLGFRTPIAPSCSGITTCKSALPRGEPASCASTSSSPDTGKPSLAISFRRFPNLMFNAYPWGISDQHGPPLAVDRTRVSFLTYVWDPSELTKWEPGASSIAWMRRRGHRRSRAKRPAFAPLCGRSLLADVRTRYAPFSPPARGICGGKLNWGSWSGKSISATSKSVTPRMTASLEQRIFGRTQSPFSDPCGRSIRVLLRLALREHVHHRPVLRLQKIRDQAAMALPPKGLRAYDCRAPLLRKFL